MRRPNFRLRSLFLITLVLALVLSGLVWRSRMRMESARVLHEANIGFTISSDGPAWLPSLLRNAPMFARPVAARIFIELSKDGTITLQGDECTLDEAKRKLAALRQQIVFETGAQRIMVCLVPRETANELHSTEEGRRTFFGLFRFANDPTPPRKFSGVIEVERSTAAAWIADRWQVVRR